MFKVLSDSENTYANPKYTARPQPKLLGIGCFQWIDENNTNFLSILILFVKKTKLDNVT